MKQKELKEVEVTYCDVCGRDVRQVANMSYGLDDKHYCLDHKPWTRADIIRGHAISRICKQPFFAAAKEKEHD